MNLREVRLSEATLYKKYRKIRKQKYRWALEPCIQVNNRLFVCDKREKEITLMEEKGDVFYIWVNEE